MARALIIVDFQNDFTPGGAPAVPQGDQNAGPVKQPAPADDLHLVDATRDWRPPDHGSFTEQGGIWPVHCVAGTPGAELHPALERANVDVIVDKGQARDADGYSAFEATELSDLLGEREVDQIVVVG